jgi:hydroxyacylglutathione hydrolase
MLPVYLIAGFSFALLAIGVLFNPLRVTDDKIRVATFPTESNLDGQEFAVQPISFGICNIYLIKTRGGYILVDTGMPNMERQIDVAFAKAGVDPDDVQLIIVTHGHLDHVGTVAYAKQLTGADLLCHQSYAEHLEKGEVVSAIAQNNLGRFMELLTQLSRSKFDGVKPDILLEEEFKLDNYGIAGKVIHTLGHSSDSVSIILDTGEALIGDMLRGRASNANIGMFYEDEQALLASLEKIAAFNPDIIYLSHGAYINNSELQTAIDATRVELSM